MEAQFWLSSCFFAILFRIVDQKRVSHSSCFTLFPSFKNFYLTFKIGFQMLCKFFKNTGAFRSKRRVFVNQCEGMMKKPFKDASKFLAAGVLSLLLSTSSSGLGNDLQAVENKNGRGLVPYSAQEWQNLETKTLKVVGVR